MRQSSPAGSRTPTTSDLPPVGPSFITRGHRGSLRSVVEARNSTINRRPRWPPRLHRQRGNKVHHVLGHYPEWEELARFEAALAGGLSMQEWGGPASAEGTAALLKSLIPVLGQISSGSALHVERLIPCAFVRSSRLRGPVTCEKFGAQPPDVRRLFLATLMATRFAPPGRQMREAARQTAEPEDHSGGAVAIPLQQRYFGHDRRWYLQTAEALLASPAGHGALQLSGRARRKALGALMRRGLAERGDARVS